MERFIFDETHSYSAAYNAVIDDAGAPQTERERFLFDKLRDAYSMLYDAEEQIQDHEDWIEPKEHVKEVEAVEAERDELKRIYDELLEAQGSDSKETIETLQEQLAVLHKREGEIARAQRFMQGAEELLRIARAVVETKGAPRTRAIGQLKWKVEAMLRVIERGEIKKT